MAIHLTKMTTNVNNIQALSDLPNQTDGLTSQGLKERFDKAGSDIKTFINTSMIPELEQVFSQEIETIKDSLYPVGRGFIDFTDTDYSNYLGFTWERELMGMTPIGLNTSDPDFDYVGKTGGEKTHKLTVEELPSHTHKYGVYLDWYAAGGKKNVIGGSENKLNSSSTGGNQPHNNLQPYKVVSYWKRVS